MQMFFNKINSGSPFGIISLSPQLIQFLDKKRHFIGFVKIDCNLDESLFFVYENNPSATFNLKNYLLVLAQMHGNPTAIGYCENKQDDTQNTDTKEIKFLSARSRHDFGKEFRSTEKIGILNHDELCIQSLLGLGSSLRGKTIERFYNPPTNYSPVTLEPCFPPIPTEIEEHRKNTISDPNYNPLYYRQSSAQNIKINEIADDLKNGFYIIEGIKQELLPIYYL